MQMTNLADPEWISVQCHKVLICDVMCESLEKQADEKQTEKKSVFSFHEMICMKMIALLDAKCYTFFWYNNVENPRKQLCQIQTQTLKLFAGNVPEHLHNLFNAISNEFLSILVSERKNCSFAYSFLIRKHLSHISIVQSIVPQQKAKGFLVFTSEPKGLIVDTNVFQCSNGDYV